MAQENAQSVKLLIIYEMLRQETDEEHPMDSAAIIARLAEKGISCDRRTLTRNLRCLNDFGFEVMSAFSGHEKVYYKWALIYVALGLFSLESLGVGEGGLGKAIR